MLQFSGGFFTVVGTVLVSLAGTGSARPRASDPLPLAHAPIAGLEATLGDSFEDSKPTGPFKAYVQVASSSLDSSAPVRVATRTRWSGVAGRSGLVPCDQLRVGSLRAVGGRRGNR